MRAWIGKVRSPSMHVRYMDVGVGLLLLVSQRKRQQQRKSNYVSRGVREVVIRAYPRIF